VLYEIFTSADVPVTSTAKTVLLFDYSAVAIATAAPLFFTVVDWDIDIEGAAGSTSGLAELVESTQAGTGTFTADNTAFRQLRGPKAVNPTTAIASGGWGCLINRAYSVEPTVLTPLIGPRKFLQGSSWTKQFPLGLQLWTPSPVGGSKGIGIRATVPVSANCRASLQLALGAW
jgi:hypothetical protein